jgi:argininosuccinate lyase
LSLEEYRRLSPFFSSDIYDAISIEACVSRRNTYGGPARKAVEDCILSGEAWIEIKKTRVMG